MTSITETGVTWTKQKQNHYNNYLDVEIWFGVVGASPSKDITINVASDLSSYGGIANVCEFSGVKMSSMLDKTAANSGTSVTETDTGTTDATTSDVELWIGCTFTYDGSAPYTDQTSPTNGFTLKDGVSWIAGGAGYLSNAFMYKVTSAKAAANTGATTDTTAWFDGCIITLLPAAVTYSRTITEIAGGQDFDPALATNSIDSYSETYQDSSYVLDTVDDNIGVGQSFTMLDAENDYVLNNCKFFLSKTGSPPGSVYAKVYAHQGTFGSTSVPTGPALATSDAVACAGIGGSFALVTFTFSNLIHLKPNTHYVVTVEYNGGDSSNHLTVGIQATSPTHPGNFCLEHTAGWAYSASRDTCFYVYGTLALIKFVTRVKVFLEIAAGLDSLTFTIGGVTRNSAGAVLPGCTVLLFKTSDESYQGQTTSDASGKFKFTVADKTVTYFLVAFKAGSPNVQGTTYNDITAGPV